DQAIALLRELAQVPATHEHIFMQGGETQQLAQVPLNYLPSGARADYVINGVWGEKALAEAKTVGALFGGKIHVAAETGVGERKKRTYVRTPKASELRLSDDAAYVHVTSNETIHGVQFAPGRG